VNKRIVIESKNLCFCPFQEKDFDLFYEIYSDKKLMKYVNKPLDREQAELFFKKTLKQYTLKKPKYFIGQIIDKQNKKIGLAGIFWNHEDARSLSENRNRNEGKLGLGLFSAFLRRIVALFDEKKRKIAQIQLFCNRFSILGQAPRSLSENRNRNEGELDLGRFFAFLRRIVALFDEKKRKMAQIQLFCNRFSILGQAPRTAEVGAMLLANNSNKGYGSEVFKAIMKELFTNRGIDQVVYCHHPQNTAAHNICQSLGCQIMEKNNQTKKTLTTWSMSNKDFRKLYC